jgi:predicted TIM-barrel fold metal-dependent hydrolase
MSHRPSYLTGAPSLDELIPGPVLDTSTPKIKPPSGSVDCHAHIFGPSDRFPYAEGRGYTPPDAPLELFLKMDDAIGCDRAVVVQGNAHGYDNRAILDAVSRQPDRLRGICITDTRVTPDDLRHWHTLGIRGLRFHLHVPHDRPAYVRGVGFDVLEAFTPVMLELGWHAQVWCAWALMEALAEPLRKLSRQMPVVIDHMLSIEASQGVNNPNFQALLKLLGEGACWVKTSGAYRLSNRYPDYPDARPFHEALVRTNPEQLVWGSDWPHASMDAAMPDDGKLMDLFNEWTPDAATREKILVRNPERLYGFPRWNAAPVSA